MGGRGMLSLCMFEFVFVFIYVQEVQGGGHGILDGRILWFYRWAKIAGWKYKGKKTLNRTVIALLSKKAVMVCFL